MENRDFQARQMDRQQEVTMSYATACAEVCCVLGKEHQAFKRALLISCGIRCFRELTDSLHPRA